MGLDVKKRKDGCQREVATSNVDEFKTLWVLRSTSGQA